MSLPSQQQGMWAVVLNMGFRLTQVDLYRGHKMVVYVCVNDNFHREAKYA